MRTGSESKDESVGSITPPARSGKPPSQSTALELRLNMPRRVKKWLSLPFLGGASTAHDFDHNHNEDGDRSKENHPDQEGVLSKHESAADFAKKGEGEIILDYNAPIHWWMMSSLFPLIAGTFGPMASTFNICAIAIDWRVIVDSASEEAEGMKITDPRWLVAVNGVSLAIAIIANGALLAQMTGRLRFDIAHPIVIGGWFISGLILIALVSAADTHVPLPTDNPMAVYSQAFYYGAFAGALYILLSAMLSTTAYGIWIGHYGDQFKLSLSQRSLMLQTMLLLGYILASAAVYTKIEGWNFLDSVYFMVITYVILEDNDVSNQLTRHSLFTIGFGDYTPATHLGRGLFFPMAVGGDIFVGLIIANIRALVIESGSVKVSTRLMEKARYKALKAGNPAEGVVKIRGTQKRDTNADTELERREKEFHIMRELQKTSAQNNRLLALFLASTAFMILWFIGAVVFWQAEQATGGQNWTYFESLYFTYVAQLTIGYGDFEPQTNSAKPAFVFWALIALPTLTVLIGSIGDNLSDFVNFATVWIGRHADPVLSFFTLRMKENRDTSNAIETTIKKAKQENHEDREGFDNIVTIEDGKLIPADLSASTFASADLKTVEDAYLPYLMLSTAKTVLSHLDDEAPRKYTYQEWTWLLRLLGEDESTKDGHRIIGKPVDGEVATPLTGKRDGVWSWMGQESPLMSLKGGTEPKWVLYKIMDAMERELKMRGHRRMARETDRPVDEVREKIDEESQKQESNAASSSSEGR
nr:outward-rectifier potassium channel tok1 [Quercus suber]